MGSEKLSIWLPSPTSVKGFHEMVQASGLNDLGFRGNSYTWANNRKGHAYVVAKLDRALANVNWMDSFDDSILSHFPRLSSDHNPIVLSHRKHLSPGNIPFKFEEMWLSHESFSTVVENSWAISCSGSPQCIIATQLKNLKCNLKAWNRDVFGQLKNIVDA